MNIDTIKRLASKANRARWGMLSIAAAVITAPTIAVLAILPIESWMLWRLLPLVVMCASVSWALWWPINYAAWLGWFAMIVRLVASLFVSMVVWMISAVLQ